MAEIWSRFRAAGLTSERGFLATNMRPYVEMVRWLAREELRMFSRGVADSVGRDEAVRMAEVGIELGNQLLGVLRRETLLRFIGQGNLPATPERKSRTGDDAS